MFTATQKSFLTPGGGRELERLELRALVGTVTKRLF
jgi:hypothetical protein